MEAAVLERLKSTIEKNGPDAGIDALCAELKNEKDYQGLFYALLMKKRLEIGVCPIATGSNADVPADKQQAFEDGIRQACRTVGKLYLDEGQFPQAFGYYRMIGEVDPLADALEKVELTDDVDCQPLIDIAFHQGVLPKRGFEWLLQRYGICNAITTVTAGEMPFPPDVKHHCVKLLIRTLHQELLARLVEEVKQKQGFEPTAKTIKDLVEGRDWLFADEYYHVDLSHLNAVVQMAGQLSACDEVRQARDLCAYGKKLSPRFQYPSDPPFDNLYADYEVYLSILLHENVDENLKHFYRKAADADLETIGTYPAEVLVNLLLRIGRPQEALAVAKKYLTKEGETRHSCPSFVELCQQTKSYADLAEVAKAQGNAVNYVAGLLAQARK
jgi:hypothetical protein